MTVPRFVSVNFYPPCETSSTILSGRYVALGDDGRVYVKNLDFYGDTWFLLGTESYPERIAPCQ